MTKDEALKQALAFIKYCDRSVIMDNYEDDLDVIEALLEEALAKPEQEPVCPDCTAKVLYECVFCSSNNYPPKEQPEQEPVSTWGVATAHEAEVQRINSELQRLKIVFKTIG
jgi:hypothetical protein